MELVVLQTASVTNQLDARALDARWTHAYAQRRLNNLVSIVQQIERHVAKCRGVFLQWYRGRNQVRADQS